MRHAVSSWARGRPSGPGRPRWILVAAIVATVAVLAAVVVIVARHASTASGSSAAPPPPAKVIASIPYWYLWDGAASVEAHRSAVDEVSPWIYAISPDSGVMSVVPPQDVAQATTTMSQLRALGVPLMPSVSNMVNGDFSYSDVARMIHDPALVQRNVSAITQLAVSQGYAGIDLDYEELQGTDRQAFSDYVTALAASLHGAGKKLSVAVFAKVDDAGDDQRNVAQDYVAIGRAADEVRLMTYDYHWETSPPGPIAPSGWVRDVLAYATSVIPRQKLVVGLDMAGYDWVGNQANPITITQAQQFAQSHHAQVQFDPLSQSPWFRYSDPDGTQHEVWFENAASIAAKQSVVAAAGVRSVFLWMYGPPDSGIWAGLSTHHPSTTSTQGGN